MSKSCGQKGAIKYLEPVQNPVNLLHPCSVDAERYPVLRWLIPRWSIAKDVSPKLLFVGIQAHNVVIYLVQNNRVISTRGIRMYQAQGTLTATPPFHFNQPLDFIENVPITRGEQIVADGTLTRTASFDGQLMVYRVQFVDAHRDAPRITALR